MGALTAAWAALLALGCAGSPGSVDSGPFGDSGAGDTGVGAPSLQEALDTTLAQVVAPTNQDLGDGVEAVHAAVVAFCASPTLVTHEAAVVQLAVARRPLKHQQAYAVGPSVDLGLADAIDPWPEFGEAIEAGLDDGVEVDATWLSEAPADDHVRGFPAVGYLLHSDGDETVARYQADTAGARCAWLQATTTHMADVVPAWIQAWSTQSGSDPADQAAALFAHWAALSAELATRNLGEPLGQGVAAPAQVEARYSGASLELLSHTLDGIEAAYEGDGQAGFQAWLVGRDGGAADDAAIVAALDHARDAVAAVPWPLDQAVVDAPDAVADAQQALMELSETLGMHLDPDRAR